MEVNTRVNYPIKSALVEMVDCGDISVDDDICKACVSWFSMKVASVGIASFVNAWNSHTIPGICFLVWCP